MRAEKTCTAVGAGACSAEHLGEAGTVSVDMLLAAAIAADQKAGAGAKKRDADSLMQQVQNIASELGDLPNERLPRHCLRILEAFRILNQLYEVVHTSHMETLTILRICKVSCLVLLRKAIRTWRERPLLCN